MEWFYVKAGEQQGPVDEAALAELRSSGAIADNTLVWKEGMGDWIPYRDAGIGPAAAPFFWPNFLFRLLVPGLLLGYLYRLRGLAFVVYLHTAYCLTWAVMAS